MNSDQVQRYHIRRDGVIFNIPSGEWVRYEDVELKEAFTVLHTHQSILNELKNLQTERFEKCSCSIYGKGFLYSIDKCIDLITKSMEENI